MDDTSSKSYVSKAILYNLSASASQQTYSTYTLTQEIKGFNGFLLLFHVEMRGVLIGLRNFGFLDGLDVVQHLENLLFFDLASNLTEDILVRLLEGIHGFDGLITNRLDFPLSIALKLLLKEKLLALQFLGRVNIPNNIALALHLTVDKKNDLK